MAASVRIEDEAFSDVRYDVLARVCQLADDDHARGKMAKLWRQCTAQQSYVLHETIVVAVLGPNGPIGIVESNLGVAVDGGIRIRGTRGRIEWLGRLRKNAAKGGRAKSAKRHPEGRPDACLEPAKSLPPPCPPAPAPAPAPSEDPEKEKGAAPSVSSAAQVRHERALALSVAAVSEINRLRNTRYKPDSESTLKFCHALATSGVTPDQLVATIRHVACPRKGSEGWLASETFRERVCPETLLQAKRVLAAIATIEATGTPTLVAEARRDDDYSRIPGMEVSQ